MLNLHIQHKAFNHSPLFDNFKLSLKEGELLCLLGPSGCGKTSLLNMIAGLDQNYQGVIEYDQSLRISYMFQEPRLLPWRTVKQNLELVIKGSTTPFSDSQNLLNRIPALLEQMGLAHSLNQYPAELSLGMARRVALARCLITEPQLILMDEPFVSLDSDNLNILYKQLQQLRQQQPELAIVLVTHDIREALRLADRIVLFDRLPISSNKEFIPALPPMLRQSNDIQQMEQQLSALSDNQLAKQALNESNKPMQRFISKTS